MTNNVEIDGLRTFITYRLSRIQSRLNAQAIRLLKLHGDVSLTEWRVLSITELLDTVTLSDLVRESELDKGQLSRSASALIRKGYLLSTANQKDQRSHLLSLTRAGRDCHARMLPIMRRRQENLVDALTPEEIAVFDRVLEKLDAASQAPFD